MGGRGRVAAVIAASILILLAGTAAVVSRMANADGAETIRDAAQLPDDIEVCGRSWKRGGLLGTFTVAGIRERFGVDPVVVDPRPFPACPAGACTRVAAEPCHTVVWVRVGKDAYVDYALRGGP